jgi:hypothetical protein
MAAIRAPSGSAPLKRQSTTDADGRSRYDRHERIGAGQLWRVTVAAGTLGAVAGEAAGEGEGLDLVERVINGCSEQELGRLARLRDVRDSRAGWGGGGGGMHI